MSKVEEFKLQEGLRPIGLLATVTKRGLSVFDFDCGQDKKACSAHVVGYFETDPVFASFLSEDHQKMYLQTDITVAVVGIHYETKWQV